MAMTTCKECAKEISSTASACPHCGAKVPRTKWWLWVPLGLIGLFLAYGLSIPQYVSDANRARELCEQMIGGRGTARQYECDRLHHEAIERGKAAAQSR